MIELALIPVLGALALFGVSIFVLNRRGTKAAIAKAAIDEKVAALLRKDRENDGELVEQIVQGIAIDECLARHGTRRGGMFPGPHVKAVEWTLEDVQSWQKQALSEEIEAVNRRLLLPSFGAAIVIIAVCVVVATVSYSFQSSRHAVSPFTAPAGETPDLLNGTDALSGVGMSSGRTETATSGVNAVEAPNDSPRAAGGGNPSVMAPD